MVKHHAALITLLSTLAGACDMDTGSSYNPSGGASRKATLWGQRQLLSTDPAAPVTAKRSATVVDTQLFAIPRYWLVLFRFQTPPAGTFILDETAWVTVAPVDFVRTFYRAIDAKGDVTNERGAVVVGTSLVSVTLGAHALRINVELTQAAPTSMWIEVLAIPIDSATPEMVLATNGALGGYSNTVVTRVPAAAADTLITLGNSNRRQLIVVNNSAQDLALLFGPGVPSLAAGAENFSLLLPGGAFATYESPIGGYVGTVRGIWRAADAAGEALVTVGF